MAGIAYWPRSGIIQVVGAEPPELTKMFPPSMNEQQRCRYLRNSYCTLIVLNSLVATLVAVADPGFPQGGCQLSRGAPTYDFAKFSRKLHEIERIGCPGGRAPPVPPLNLPLSGSAFWQEPYFIQVQTKNWSTYLSFAQNSSLQSAGSIACIEHTPFN